MNIQELVELAKSRPSAFHIIGKGGRCLALAHTSHFDHVLLLEKGKDDHGAGEGQGTDRAHNRAVTFARQYDEYISAGVGGVTNGAGIPFVHPGLVGALDPKHFGQPLYLHVGNGKIFVAKSARLIKRIPGQALHYFDFVDPKSPVRNKLDVLAADIAKWLYVFHHQVSPGAMVGSKIEKQYRDAGKTFASRTLTSEKHRILVVENVREIRKLEEGMARNTMHPDFRKRLTENLQATGVNFPLLSQTAKQLEVLLREILPTDRIGLTHSDLHPANIVVSKDYGAVNGICDWMTGAIDAQSIDFAGLGQAHGLLPKVLRAYKNLEIQNGVNKQINPQAVYAYAAMRQLFITLKAVKNGFGEGTSAIVAWKQAGECLDQLGRLNPRFRSMARKFKHQRFFSRPLSIERSQLGTRPIAVLSR